MRYFHLQWTVQSWQQHEYDNSHGNAGLLRELTLNVTLPPLHTLTARDAIGSKKTKDLSSASPLLCL